MREKSLIAIVDFVYFNENDLGFINPIREGLRLSLWQDANDFTAAEISQIRGDSSEIVPGQTKRIVMKILPTRLSSSFRSGDLVFCGVPYNKIGECRIVEVTTD